MRLLLGVWLWLVSKTASKGIGIGKLPMPKDDAHRNVNGEGHGSEKF